MQDRYGMTPDEALLQKTPFSFDVSFWEFFWPLMVGARLVVARPGGHREPAYLAETIRREGVTTIFPESSVNPKLEKAIAAEAGAEVGPALWADTLGETGSAGATYLGAMRANAEAMAQGFSDGQARCDLPR
jgi:hypothetical protein